MAIDKKAKKILDKYQTLKAQRSTWEDHWQDVANYFLPRKSNITLKRTRGDKRHDQIYDGTATHALELLSASLNGMLTNTISPWFVLKYRSEMMNQDDEAKEWLESCANIMQQVFQRSNFQQEIFELYHELLAFGTSAMFITDDVKDDLRFKTIHISEIYITENEKGMVDCLVRKFQIKNKNIPAMYPEANLPQSLVKKIQDNPYDETTIIHSVQSSDTPMGYESNKNMDFTSCHVHEESGIILRDSGFREFPYVVPRYLKSSSNEIYGRSPAMNALPDVKMLNTMCKTTIKAAQKQIDPPLMVPDDGFVLPVRTVPGGLNFYRSGTRERIEPLNIGANNPIGLQMEEQRRKAIRENFFVDQLMMIQGVNMTATEVMQRTEEKMRLLGPVMGRLQAELLQPLIERAYNILSRDNAFAEVPDILQNNDIEIDYVSPLAKAQRQGDVQSALQLLEIMAPLAQVDPSIMDYIDVDGMSKHIIKTLGVPATAVRGDEEVKKVRNERQAAQAVEQEKQDILTAAEAAGNAAPLMKAMS